MTGRASLLKRKRLLNSSVLNSCLNSKKISWLATPICVPTAPALLSRQCQFAAALLLIFWQSLLVSKRVAEEPCKNAQPTKASAEGARGNQLWFPRRGCRGSAPAKDSRMQTPLSRLRHLLDTTPQSPTPPLIPATVPKSNF